jgi:hypothetical protein
VSHVLIVPAIKFGNPMMLVVLVKTNDATIHESLRVRPSGAEATFARAGRAADRRGISYACEDRLTWR